MSSREQTQTSAPRSRRRVLALIGAALLTAPLLPACQPLYGNTQSGARLQDVMAGLEITKIPGRVGQRVRNELIFTTTGGRRPAAALYRLDISVREHVTNTLVELTGNAQGQLFNLDARFKLVRLADNKVVLEGKSAGRAALDRTSICVNSLGAPTACTPLTKRARLHFSDVRALIDAENRAARVVADGIKTRIAAFLSSTA